MSIIKSDLDKKEYENSLLALIVVGIIVGICTIISLELHPTKVFMQSITASLAGVFLAVYFINYRITIDKQKFKKLYISKFSPILKRIFMYMYISLKHVINFEKGGISSEDYKTVLNRHNELVLDKKGLNRFELDKVFESYKENLIHQTSINSRFLPENLVLNISEIIERLDSFILQIRLNDNELILKNIKAIFKHLKVIDDMHIKLDLDLKEEFKQI